MCCQGILLHCSNVVPVAVTDPFAHLVEDFLGSLRKEPFVFPQIALHPLHLPGGHQERICFGGEHFQEDEHESVLLDVHQVVFELSCSWGGDSTTVPGLPGVDILSESGEGVNQEAQHISVAFEDIGEEQVPLPVGELHLFLSLKLLDVLIPRKALLRGVTCRGESLVVGVLEQSLVQSFGVTGEVVREHVECSSQWQWPLTHVHIQDCFADICSGDVEHTGFLTPDPRRVVTMVSPPVDDTSFHCFVVTDVGVRHTTVHTSPAVTLPGVRLQHQR